MTAGRTTGASTSGGPRPVSGLTHTVCSNLSLEPRASGGKTVNGYVLVHMHSLGMLAQVVESGEAPGAVALERPFTSVLSICRSTTVVLALGRRRRGG
jgi:hypothetical protein